jgi:hypothetical protein
VERLKQPDYLDGKLAYVGPGVDIVDIHLQEQGVLYRCTATSETAGNAATYLNGPTLRAFGMAGWTRQDNGAWLLEDFHIENFITLEDKTLHDALSAFDNLPSPDWKK